MSVKEFVCDYCSRCFTRKYNLQTHIENCHETASSYCDICDQKFGSPGGLQLHLNRGHNRYAQPFPECDICGRIFTRKQNIVSHMITVHLQGTGTEIRCEACDRSFTTTRNLKRHMKLLHNPDIEYPTCDYCSKHFKSKHSLIMHIQAVHQHSDRTIKCNMCDRIYTNSRNLKRHIEMNHGEREEHRCHLCPKIYTSNQSLRRHFRTAHQLYDENGYHCKVKSEDTENNDSSPNSRRDVSFTCETCNNTFSEESALRQHIKSDHSFAAFYEYCKSSLEKKANLRGRHAERSGRKYEFGEDDFGDDSDLKDTRAAHGAEFKTCTCYVCFASFHSEGALARHRRECSPPPDALCCDHCDRLFTEPVSLTFHVRVFHPRAPSPGEPAPGQPTERAIYKCEECALVFREERELREHSAGHAGGPARAPPRCVLCAKDFSTRKTLRRHIKRFHEEFPPEEVASYGLGRRPRAVNCTACVRALRDDYYVGRFHAVKHERGALVFSCDACHASYGALDFAVHRNTVSQGDRSKVMLSDLCTTHMSDDEAGPAMGSHPQLAEAESTTTDIHVKTEPQVKSEPLSPSQIDDCDTNSQETSNNVFDVKSEPMSPCEDNVEARSQPMSMWENNLFETKLEPIS